MQMTDDARHDLPPEGLPPLDSGVWDAGLAAAFGADESDSSPSVLARLEAAIGLDTRVHLRDAAVTDDGPLVRPTDGGTRMAGRYRILGEIARGGVGVILKGRDVNLGRDLAMKVLRDDHAGNAELIQRFVEEAQIGGQLQHPGIVPVYELGVDDQQRPYFTMKLIQGETLARLLETRSGPDDDRVRFLRIFEQVCDAMAYAHARGVVHRDLKPANILVGSFGEVQVVDWGFAKVLSRGGVADEQSAHLDKRDAALIATVRSGPAGMESQVGSVMGTPSYMPPEQALGRVDALDERTDVFALGAILCEMATGKPPYVGETIVQVALKARRAELDEAFARLDACGADEPVVALARACLQAEPTRRPRDAGRLAATVAAYLESLDQRAHDAQIEAARATERVSAERRTRRLQAIFGSCAAAAVLVAGGVFLWLRGMEKDRVHEIENGIHQALRQATRHTMRNEPELAAIALERARTLAGAPHLDPDLVQQVADQARDAANAQQDARLIADLEAVRTSDDDETSLATDVYLNVFASNGIDILQASREEIAARTGRGTDLADAVAFALDDWVFRVGTWRGVDESATRLLSIAQFLDDDAWRNELRDAAASRDSVRLLALAKGLDVSTIAPQSLDTLGLALRRGEAGAAIALLDQAVRAHRGDFYLNFHLSLLLAHFGEGREQDAIDHARIALALRPDSIGTRLFLVSLLAATGRTEEAWVYLDEALEIEPGGRRARIMRAKLMEAEGDYEASLAVLEEVILTTDPIPPLHFFRAVILVRMGDMTRAKEALRTCLDLEESLGWTGPGRGRGHVGMRSGGRGGSRGRGLGRPGMDADNVGSTSVAEIPEALRPLFDVLDRDGDGRLDGDERRVLFRLSRELQQQKSEKPETKADAGRDQG